jgi:hypothetical protein
VLGAAPGPDAGADPVRLRGGAYGRVSVLAECRGFRYDSMAQQDTGPCFYTGFLLPGEELAATFPYRAVSGSDLFTVSYIPSAAPYDGTAASLAPLTVYLPPAAHSAAVVDFTAYAENTWLRIHRGAPAVNAGVGPGLPARAVIIETGGAAVRDAAVTIDLPGLTPGFYAVAARDAAARIMQCAPGGVVLFYSGALGGYVVREGNRSWLLVDPGQRDRGALLPALPPSLLLDADSGKAVTFRVGEKQAGSGPGNAAAGGKFWGRYPVRYGDGMYTRGEFIEITGPGLLFFLKKVLENRGTIERHDYYFGSRYYELRIPSR